MARSLPEAILEALSGVGQDVAGQMRQNDLLNANRRDAMLRLRDEQDERKRRAADEQAERDRRYSLEIEEDKARNVRQYMLDTKAMLEQGEGDVRDEQRYKDEQGWKEKYYNLAMETENRLREKDSKPKPAGPDPFNLSAAKYFMSSRSNRADQGGLSIPQIDSARAIANTGSVTPPLKFGQDPVSRVRGAMNQVRQGPDLSQMSDEELDQLLQSLGGQ